MSIDFGQLKAFTAGVGTTQLALSSGGSQVEQAADKSWLGKKVAWLNGDAAKQNQDVRAAVQICLARTYSLDHGVDSRAVQAAMSKVDWASTAPLSSRQVSQVIDQLEATRRAGAYVDHNLQGGNTTVLGSGNVNTVHLGAWKVGPAPADKMVFKAEAESGGALQAEGVNIGIPAGSPNLSGRNVATFQLSSALGLDVIPKTHYAVHAHEAGTVMALAPGGSVQGSKTVKIASGLTPEVLHNRFEAITEHFASKGLDIVGMSDDGTLELRRTPISDAEKEQLFDTYEQYDSSGQPLSIDAIRSRSAKEGPLSEATLFLDRFDARSQLNVALNVDDPALRSGMNQLQWLDNLCGQADRHPGNIFIERNPHGQVVGVKGIDNDVSFGVNSLGNLANVRDANGAGQVKYPAVPKVIDAGLRDQLLQMASLPVGAPGSIEQLLGNTLSPLEVSAARARLMNLNDHLTQTGPNAVRVIDSPNGWNDGAVDALMGFGSTPLPAIRDGASNGYLQTCELVDGHQGTVGVLKLDITALRADLAELLNQTTVAR